MGFEDEGMCVYYEGVQKDGGLIRRMDKSKGKLDVGVFRGEQRAYEDEERRRVKEEMKRGKEKKDEEERERKRLEEENSYERVFERVDLNDKGGNEDLFGDEGDWGEGGGGYYANEADFF